MVNQKAKKGFPPILIFFSIVCFLIVPSIDPVQGEIDSPYLTRIVKALELSSGEIEILEANNFVVVDQFATDDIMDAYIYYWENDLPIMITTDAMLQVWHLMFDQALLNIEEQIIYYYLSSLIRSMKDLLFTESCKNNLMVRTSILLQKAMFLLNF